MSTVVSLNGEWEFTWDTDTVGLDHRWYVTPPESLESVQIPHLWEKEFSKTNNVGFYFKRFTVDSSENAKRIFLRFNRIASQAAVWLNGKYLGAHFGSYSPFSFDTSKAVKVGEENLLAVRVSTAEPNGRMDLGRTEVEGSDRFSPVNELPVGLPWLQYPFAGIRGDVDLILGDRAFITDSCVVPNPDQEKISLELQFCNPRNFMAKLHILVMNPKGEVSELHKEIKLEKENHNLKLPLSFKDVAWWTPETPDLYKIEVILENSLSVLHNFAFRKFDCLKGDFFLNDKVIRLQGLAYNQHDQEGGLFTEKTEKMQADLKRIKDLGFNVIRSHGAPLPDEALNLCDELGIMVFQEFPIHQQKSSPRGLDRAKIMIEETTNHYKSHPCIVAWVLGVENGTMMLENGTKLLKTVDQFDQTRPVFSNLNSVYLDNCQKFTKDTGKIMGVTNERISLYPSHRLHLRMNLSQSLSNFLSDYCNQELEDVEVPDMTLGDSQFQEEYQSFVHETHGKILVTLKNHSLLTDCAKIASKMTGLRANKNAKALQTLGKQIKQFVEKGEGKAVFKNEADFITQANQIALKSKLDQINALQSNPQISGFFLEQWADIGTDLSGLNNEFRVSKDTDAFIREITSSTRLLISTLERCVAVKGSVEFKLTLLNEARLGKAEVLIRILDSKNKEVTLQKKAIQGETSLTSLGDFSIAAPSKEGDYSLEISLIHGGKTLSTLREPLRVMGPPDYKKAMESVCFLDEAESSSEAMQHINRKEKIIFTSSISSWNDSILNRLAEAIKSGKTLFISDMNQDDVDTFNACTAFEISLECQFATGSNGASYHYTCDKFLAPAFSSPQLLDCTAAVMMPSMSLGEIEGAKVHARSLSIEEGELLHGVDLQLLPLGKGQIVFCQYNLLDNLESNPLADQVFATLVKACL